MVKLTRSGEGIEDRGQLEVKKGKMLFAFAWKPLDLCGFIRHSAHSQNARERARGRGTGSGRGREGKGKLSDCQKKKTKCVQLERLTVKRITLSCLAAREMA